MRVMHTPLLVCVDLAVGVGVSVNVHRVKRWVMIPSLEEQAAGLLTYTYFAARPGCGSCEASWGCS
jgi:hypothetical protein